MQNWQMTNDGDKPFAELISDVKPLRRSQRVVPHKPKPAAKAVFSQRDQQSLLEESLNAPDFSQIETGDILSWHRDGIQKTVLRKLRRGHYTAHDELDLHGLNQTKAKTAVQSFLNHAAYHHHSCVRIVHGKGNRSEYGPVLKRAIGGWLVKRKDVMAFASTPAHDGGTGAIYVLLKTAR